MQNFWQDPAIIYFIQLLQQNFIPNWPYCLLFYLPNQTTQTLENQQSKPDESSNESIQLKKQENSRILQVQVPMQQESPKKTENKKKFEKTRSQDANYVNKSQKGDRNLNSIVIRNFINFLNGHPNLLELVKTIVQKKNLRINPQDFIAQLKNKFQTRQPYVGVGKLKKFIEIGKQSHDIRQITMVLMRKFISIDFFTVMLNSKKVSKAAKEKELKHGKKFWREFCRQLR